MLDAFETLVLERRSVRNFNPDPIPESTLLRLLELAHWAPSGFNLQPTHLFVVTDEQLKRRLLPACMDQRQVLEAPATVVFTGDRRAVDHNFEKMIRMEKELGSIDDAYAEQLGKFAYLAFEQGPFGLGWLFRALVCPAMRLAKPMPSIPAIQKRYWLTKQVMLAAMVFMLAAKAADLCTVPMEGFDESRVKKVLGIPSSHIVPLVIPVGYGETRDLKKTRLPLDDLLHFNRW